MVRLSHGILTRFAVVSLLMATTTCNKPVTTLQQLNGCYVVKTGDIAFKIDDGNLSSGDFRSELKILRILDNTSVISFNPSVRVTSSPNKLIILKEGTDRGAMSYIRSKKTFVLMDIDGFPVTFVNSGCLN